MTFIDDRAYDKDRMYSVMYALLEGLSRQMGIERNDIKGCLHYSDTDAGLVYSLILYDAVAGGAGNVRRMVTDDGSAFEDVLAKALELVGNCKCDSSCYNCLRNYYNQKIHDQLNRHAAQDFLKDWLGEPQPIEDAEPEFTGLQGDIGIECDNIFNDYANWSELAATFEMSATSMSHWDDAGIPYTGQFLATLTHPDGDLDTIVVWSEQKLALCEADNLSSTARFEAHGWRFMDANAEPERIRAALNGGN